MPATAYATLEEFVNQLEANSAAPVDDEWIKTVLMLSSREFDGDTQHWFYADTQTRYYDLPTRGRCLELDVPLLSVTTVTNGDDTTIAATEYNLYPLNGPHKSEIRLKQSSTTVWQPGTSGDTEGVVSVLGSWGYVNRSATDPESLRVISNTKAAVLALTTAVYRKRYGANNNPQGAVTITGAGVVITPKEKSPEYWALVSLYQRHL